VILKKNADKNGGFYTCENCRFQHKQSTYATLKGGRMGDGSFHVDHKTPASNGGMASKRNSAVLCGTCNTSKGNRLAAKATGMDKYKGLHRKSVPKDYIRKPRVKKR
jgi:5-methylcytosine-specific restriction endonuclease McrA|tara:strand:- start:37313 stop:37633 length:321 start_codon:yes stop_codon:yes gene_type:complete